MKTGSLVPVVQHDMLGAADVGYGVQANPSWEGVVSTAEHP